MQKFIKNTFIGDFLKVSVNSDLCFTRYFANRRAHKQKKNIANIFKQISVLLALYCQKPLLENPCAALRCGREKVVSVCVGSRMIHVTESCRLGRNQSINTVSENLSCVSQHLGTNESLTNKDKHRGRRAHVVRSQQAVLTPGALGRVRSTQTKRSTEPEGRSSNP